MEVLPLGVHRLVSALWLRVQAQADTYCLQRSLKVRTRLSVPIYLGEHSPAPHYMPVPTCGMTK